MKDIAGALAKGYEIIGEVTEEISDNEEHRRGYLELVRRGPSKPATTPGGETYRIEGDILGDVRVPFTAEYRFGRPRQQPLRKPVESKPAKKVRVRS